MLVEQSGTKSKVLRNTKGDMPLHLKSYTETTVFGTLQVPSHFGFHLMFLRRRPLCLSGLLSICLSVFIEDPVNLNSLIYLVYTCLCPVSNPPLLISNLTQCLAYHLDLHGEGSGTHNLEVVTVVLTLNIDCTTWIWLLPSFVCRSLV